MNVQNRKSIALVLVGLIAGLTLGTLGIAGAATSASKTTTPTQFGRGFDGFMGGANGMFRGAGANLASLPSVVASLTGTAVEDVISQRQAGKSFADIAKAEGVSSDEVVDEAVERASTRLRTRFEAEMTETGPMGPGMGRGMGGRGMRGGAALPIVVASLTGMTIEDVISQRQAGKSFADIAKAEGVSSDEVVDEALKRATTMLDAAVEAGRITADQKTRILADLETHLKAEVTETGLMGPGMGPGMGRGMGGRGFGGRGMMGGGPAF